MHPKTAINTTVHIVKDGPYVVSGHLPMIEQAIGINAARDSVKWVTGTTIPSPETYALCRCGKSKSKPFCDGSHAKVGFVGTETARRDPHQEQAKIMRGPTMTLSDAEALCAFARFCDTHGQVWNLVNATNDPAASKHFLKQSADCPSGRLVAWDNASHQPVEPTYEPSIGLIEDPAKGCSGPIWLRGGVQVVGADGFKYEVRNRVTLCRCGASQNKPFCDGTHAAIHFNDKR